jgi:hypothetical protein
LSFFENHLRRHHNPHVHVIAAVCTAAGSFLLVRQGYPVIAGLVGVLSLLNVAHAIAEYRQPNYRQQWAEEHLRNLRERAARELGSNGDAEHP